MRFLDGEIKGRVMPLTMIGDLGRRRRMGCCRAGGCGDFVIRYIELVLLALYPSKYYLTYKYYLA